MRGWYLAFVLALEAIGPLRPVAAAPPVPSPAPPAAPAANLADAIKQHDVAQAALKTKAQADRELLRKWYSSALEAVRKDVTSKGDLDTVLQIDPERERLDRELTLEEKSKLAPVLGGVRGRYDQARANLAQQERAAWLGHLRAYAASLEGLERALTQKGEIDAALEVRKERTAAIDEVLANGAGAPPAVAGAPPPAGPAATPATTSLPATPRGNLAPFVSGANQAPRELQASIPANTPEGFALGEIRKGTKISLQYQRGQWKSWGRLATGNPDKKDTEGGDRCRMVIALPGDGKGGEVLAMVPPDTAGTPFVFEAKADYPAVVLRINDQEGSFGGNPGKVEYVVKITPARR